MFKIYKLYIKWKLISLVKDKIADYTKEKNAYIQHQEEWRRRTNNRKCFTDEQFEEKREEEINFCSAKWKENYFKLDAASEILKIIEAI
jgi:hypothetical protein